MSAGLEQVKVELSDATSTLSAISEELGASAQEVSATYSQVADECEATNGMSTEMSSTNDNLINAVSVCDMLPPLTISCLKWGLLTQCLYRGKYQ